MTLGVTQRGIRWEVEQRVSRAAKKMPDGWGTLPADFPAHWLVTSIHWGHRPHDDDRLVPSTVGQRSAGGVVYPLVADSRAYALLPRGRLRCSQSVLPNLTACAACISFCYKKMS